MIHIDAVITDTEGVKTITLSSIGVWMHRTGSS
jgi:hypothetical protein